MAEQTLICIGCQYSRVSTLLAARDVCDSASLRSKPFCLVSEQRKNSVLAAREMKREPKNERGGRGRRKEGLLSSPSPPRSFSCATFRAVFYSRSSFFARKPHGNACYAGYDSAPKIPFCWHTFVRNLVNERWLVDARNVPGDEVRGQTAVFAGYDLWGEFQIYSRPIRVNWNEYVWTGENDSKTIRYVWTRFFLETTNGKNSFMQLKKRDNCKRAWDFIMQKDVKRLLYIMEKRCLKANHSLSVLKFVILFTVPWEEFNITCKHFEIFLYDSRLILILFIYFFCLPYLLAYIKQFCMRILKLTGWRLHRNRFVWVIFGSMYVK